MSSAAHRAVDRAVRAFGASFGAQRLESVRPGSGFRVTKMLLRRAPCFVTAGMHPLSLRPLLQDVSEQEPLEAMSFLEARLLSWTGSSAAVADVEREEEWRLPEWFAVPPCDQGSLAELALASLAGPDLPRVQHGPRAGSALDRMKLDMPRRSAFGEDVAEALAVLKARRCNEEKRERVAWARFAGPGSEPRNQRRVIVTPSPVARLFAAPRCALRERWMLRRTSPNALICAVATRRMAFAAEAMCQELDAALGADGSGRRAALSAALEERWEARVARVLVAAHVHPFLASFLHPQCNGGALHVLRGPALAKGNGEAMRRLAVEFGALPDETVTRAFEANAISIAGAERAETALRSAHLLPSAQASKWRAGRRG